MKASRFKVSVAIWDILVLLLVPITLYFMVRNVPFGVDFKIHNFFLEEYLQKGHFPIPPGYYLLIYLLDLLISYKYPFLISSLLILTGFIWWKYHLIEKYLGKLDVHPVSSDKKWALLVFFLGPLVLPFHAEGYWYLGKFTSSLWHNSTLLASLPFSLVLFWKTLEWWRKPTNQWPWSCFGLALLILLIKPSFLFCYLPLFPIFTWIREKTFSSKVAQSVLVSGVLLLLLWAEKQLIYAWDPMIVEEYAIADQPQILIRPFKIWFHYSANPVWDFISSFALSILFLSFWGRSALKSVAFSFSLGLLLLALLIFFLLAESGFREWHANFYWQIPIALLIHQLVMVRILREKMSVEPLKTNPKILVFLVLFSWHVLSGMAYWIRIFVEKTIS